METYNNPMETFIMDASQIDPTMDPDLFLAQFYNLPFSEPAQIRYFLYADETLRITKVFNWPAKSENWTRISLILEAIQQHSSYFYLIWGPELTDTRKEEASAMLSEIETVVQSEQPEVQTTVVDKIKI